MPECKFVELVLTCKDWAEAEKIADTLLKKHLIACAKFLPVESKYWWEGKIESDSEVLIFMESVAENFPQIETEVAKLHSYATFVLKATPITQISKDAAQWLRNNTGAKG